jgi:small subunit ribosomal protein S8
MSMQDPIADLLTRIRNAQRANHPDVSMPSSKAKLAICKVLQDEGYIEAYAVDESVKPTLSVSLRYHNGAPVIEEINRISRPGLRVYKSCAELPNVRSGLGVAIISTSNGLMSDRAARAARVGGEILCTVF